MDKDIRDTRARIESVQQQILRAELLLRAARRAGDALAANPNDPGAAQDWRDVSSRILDLLGARDSA